MKRRILTTPILLAALASLATNPALAYRDLIQESRTPGKLSECAIAYDHKPIGAPVNAAGRVCPDGERGCFPPTEQAIVVGRLSAAGPFVESDDFHSGPAIRRYFRTSQYESAKRYLDSLVQAGHCK